jgi:hypothetical protein
MPNIPTVRDSNFLKVVVMMAIDDSVKARFEADPDQFGRDENLTPIQVTVLKDKIFNPIDKELVNVQTIP